MWRYKKCWCVPYGGRSWIHRAPWNIQNKRVILYKEHCSLFLLCHHVRYDTTMWADSLSDMWLRWLPHTVRCVCFPMQIYDICFAIKADLMPCCELMTSVLDKGHLYREVWLCPQTHRWRHCMCVTQSSYILNFDVNKSFKHKLKRIKMMLQREYWRSGAWSNKPLPCLLMSVCVCFFDWDDASERLLMMKFDIPLPSIAPLLLHPQKFGKLINVWTF